MKESKEKKRHCLWVDLPETDYETALVLQHRIVNARMSGRLKHEVVLALEHTGVYTLGRRGGRENLTVSESFLKSRNISIVQVERGGNITYHGPGQLVIYPIFHLLQNRWRVVDFVAGMEAAMVRTAGYWGIQAKGDEKNRGVWIGPAKLGSIGITVRRGVSFHGLALNVNLSLEPFGWINPCGLKGVTMTSLEEASGAAVSMAAVREEIRQCFDDIFQLETQTTSLETLEKMINM